ncbi:MAG: hypothetical protein WCI22_07105, partial [Actinomycetota bacterium]
MRRSEALRLVALAALASCSVSRDAATAVSSIAPVTNRSTIQSAVVVSAAPSALLTTTTSTTSTSTVTTTTVTTTTVTTTTVTTTTVTTPDIERMRIVYGTAAVRAPSIGSIPLRMDLYLPTRPSAPVPVVVIIHGGG